MDARTPGTEPSRRELVELAVKFLQNPRVADSPLETKRAFLKTKGLTDQEMDEAIAQAQKQVAVVVSPPPPPPRSRSWQEYAAIVAVIGGAGYAVIQFIRLYIAPWILGRSERVEELEAIQTCVQELHENINAAVLEIKEAIQPIKSLLAEQSQQLQILTTHVNAQRASSSPNEQLLKEIQNEVGTLKSLMLNRHQFPALPQAGGSNPPQIPLWQKQHKSLSTSEELQQNRTAESNPPPVAHD